MKASMFALALASAALAQVTMPDGRWVDTTSAPYVAWRAQVGSSMHFSAFSMTNFATSNESTSPKQPTAKPDSIRQPSASLNSVPSGMVQQNLSSIDSALALAVPDSIVVPALNLRQTELKDVFSALGIQYGINILVDPSVTGSATLQLKKIKLRNAFRLLAQENGLQLSAISGALKVYRPPVAPPTPPPPPPEPTCTVLFENNLVTLDAQGAPLQKVVRKLSDATGVNILLEQGLSGGVELFLQKLPLAKALAALTESQNLILRERSGIWSLSQAPVSKSTDGGQSGTPFRILLEDSLITMEATQAPLQQVVTSLIQRMGGNQVILGTLNGTTTVRMSKVALPQALDLLFSGTEYTWWNREGSWYIGPLGSPGVTNSELLVLHHIKAEEALEMIPQTMQRNTQIKLMKSHNGIMVMGSRESIDGIRGYLEKLDFPVPQILIEALVVDVDMDKVRNLGVNAYLGRNSAGSATRSVYPSQDLVFDRKSLLDWASDVPGVRDVVWLPSDFFLKVKAMEQEKILQIRSRPQIATLNGSEATITVGQTQYFLLKSQTDLPEASGTTTRTTERFEKIEANVTLTVTPFVTGKNEITCDIVPDFSEPEGSFDARMPPTINRRLLKSKVRLKDGETIILGGLVKQSTQAIHDQVPLLGSIPILGWLFKNQSTTKSRSQLLIFVTPHIYYGSDSRVDPEKILKALDN